VKRLHEIAAPRKLPPGAPKPSDVCFSSRWKHPRDDKDPHDTFRTAEAFHATRLVWVYTLDAEFAAEVKRRGYGLQAAINSLVPDFPAQTRERGRILDLDGHRIAAPWMRGWKGYWGCVNSPDWRASYLATAKKCLDIGADCLQMDDPPCNLAAVAWGGCLCDHCVAAFREYLGKKATREELAKLGIEKLEAFDFRAFLKERNAPVGDAFARWNDPLKKHFAEFQRQSVAAFYAWVRPELDKHAGRRVPMSSNNYDARWSFPYDLFDFGMAELPARNATAAALHHKFQDAHARGKAQVFTFVSDDKALTRKVIATSYACGGHLIVPWDVYMGSNAARYYGKPEDYADLYKLVRDNAALFDGCEDAAIALPGVKDERYGKLPPIEVVGSRDVCAVVRAVPGQAAAPVVVHLVDWGKTPSPFRLALQTHRFFADGKLAATLLRPGQEPMPLRTAVKASQTLLDLPALGPWGIVVVAPAK